MSTGISLWTHLKKGEMNTLPNLKPLSFSAAAVACIQGIDQIQIFQHSAPSHGILLQSDYVMHPDYVMSGGGHTCWSPLSLRGGSQGLFDVSRQLTSISSMRSPCLITTRYCLLVPKGGPVSSSSTAASCCACSCSGRPLNSRAFVQPGLSTPQPVFYRLGIP